MFSKFTHRLTFLFVLLISVLITGLLFIINNEYTDYYMANLRKDMLTTLQVVAVYHPCGTENGKQKISAKQEFSLSRTARIKNIRLTIINATGTVLFDSAVDDEGSMENHLLRPEVQASLKEGSGHSVRYSDTVGYEMLYTAYSRDGVIYRASRSLDKVDEDIQHMRQKIIFAGIISLIISMVLAGYISFNVGGPVNEIINFATQFSEGNYSRRIMKFGQREFRKLQQALNHMADLIVETIENYKNEQKRLLLTIETINDGIAVLNCDGEVVLANNAFNRFFSNTLQPLGQMYYELIRNRDINMAVQKALETKEQVVLNEVSLNKWTVNLVLRPILDDEVSQGILMVVLDMSEQKRIRQIKSDLVSNVSHELKTPVAIIKGYLETIQENMDDRDMTEMIIEKALKNADRQNALINDIIKLNMLEHAGDMAIEQVSLQEVVVSCIDLLKPKIAEKNITVEVDLKDSHEPIRGNRFLVENVMYNLIDNAINYNSEKGMLKVVSSVGGDGKKVVVKDSGIGIPPEAMDRIFERFYRVDKGRSRNTGGTGLGLSIVKHSIELLGWKIDVESDSSGTVFHIILS